MKYLTTPLITLAIIGFAPLANAAEVEEVCAKYRQAFGKWSKSYKVSATLIDGSELRSKTSCYSCYDSLSKYAVMFWSNDGTTVIKLDNRSQTHLRRKPIPRIFFFGCHNNKSP